MKDLVDHIARALVDQPDQIVIDEFHEGGKTIISLHVAEEDMGRVIGKGGKIVNAIRVLIRTAATREGQRVQLEVE